MLTALRKCMVFDDELENILKSALKARNRLIHGFYERHNFKIQTEEGRDEMIADLDLLHDEFFQAGGGGDMAQLTSNIMLEELGFLQALKTPGRPRRREAEI